MPVKVVTAAMVSLGCALVGILTPIKLPNSYIIFELIAGLVGRREPEQGAYVDEMDERRPMPAHAGVREGAVGAVQL
jgi:hypothetical protein